MAETKIALIGGGTGSYTLLQSLKKLTPNITALVNMADDGGSTGVLRDELGVLPPGDIRQCLVALSDASPELRELFTFRFPNGSLQGHSFGNIFLSAVEMMTSNFNDGVRLASDILRITGRVLPMSLDDCQLRMRVGEREICGQYNIEITDIPPNARPQLDFVKQPRLNHDAREAILAADMVVIAPGNLYASLAPALLVDGVTQALQESHAIIVFVCNLVNKPNHTEDFTVHDYAAEIERFTAPQLIDYVLYNQDTPSPALLRRYALAHEYPVIIDTDAFKQGAYKAVGGNFLSHANIQRDDNDTFIKRSLIRHDAGAVVKALAQLLQLKA